MAQPPIIVDTTSNARATYLIDPLTGLPVVEGATTIADGADAAEGAKADAAYSDSTGAASGSLVSLIKGLFVSMKAGGTGAQNVQGNVAGAATDSGNPVKVGAKYNATRPTYTDGQRTDLQSDTKGNIGVNILGGNNVNPAAVQAPNADAFAFGSNYSLVTAALGYGYNETNYDRLRADTNGLVSQPYALTPKRWQYAAATGGIVNTTTAVTIAAAAGASVRNYVVAIQFDWDALGAATELAVRDGASGTVIWRRKIPAGVAGMCETVLPVPLKGTANTLVEVVTLTASVTGGVFFSAQGFQGI